MEGYNNRYPLRRLEEFPERMSLCTYERINPGPSILQEHQCGAIVLSFFHQPRALTKYDSLSVGGNSKLWTATNLMSSNERLFSSRCLTFSFMSVPPCGELIRMALDAVL